ncbi:MAG: lysophospholipid acyltransferase family protein [Prolixibacteraceae bacterium]|nr:lysophospholipid acyltransferase family protein [Prolixibacteraceae bacterium]
MAREDLEKRDKRFHEGKLKKIFNHILVGFLIVLSHLPFWILYRLADLLYLIFRFLVRYRYQVITQNLKNAFPEKSNTEIVVIRNRFYRHFCDMIFESVKMYSMSEKQMGKHIRFKNYEICNTIYDSGKSLIGLGMHYNNWEWCASVQTKIKHRVLMIYNPIRGNYAMEKFLLHSREKWGGKCVPVHQTSRSIILNNRKGQLTGLWLAADQTPAANSKFWTIFMNQETPFFSGPEKIAHSTGQPVLFQHLRKIKRGKYEAEYLILCDKPDEMEEKDILLSYIRKMEEVIREAPEYYLWSHRRWKHKRPEGIELTK